MDATSLVSPSLYPLSFDAARDEVRLVRLDEARYRAASFLDERLLAQVGPGEWVSLAELRRAMVFSRGDCDFIFHIGHVGSTLLSRLLGGDSRVFAVREPAILRALALAELAGDDPSALLDHIELFLKLWGRVYAAKQRTLLKATSFVSEIAPLLMKLSPSASAILMFVSPSVYLASILASEASRAELKVTAPTRLSRLHRRLNGHYWRLEDLSQGEWVAMSWACEILALTGLAQTYPDRIVWLDFEAFLTRPAAGLATSLRRLHGEASQARIDTMLRSADWRQYSKAPEHAYDVGLRRQVLAAAVRDHGVEINRGIAWLNEAGGRHPVLAAAFRAAAAQIH